MVTGQQAGLFGGPLYTLLKALTAVRLARRLADEARRGGRPVFWVDAEDHDLDEIRTCHVLNGELARVPVALDLGAPPGTSAAAVTLDDAILGALDALRAALPPTEFTAGVLDALAASHAPGGRLVEAFARWLDRLLGGHGLVVFDASDPAAKPFVRPLFRREVGNPGRTAQLAADAGAELTALGYHAQASPAPGAVALFRLDGGRQPIRAVDGAFACGGRTLAAETLLADVETDPPGSARTCCCGRSSRTPCCRPWLRGGPQRTRLPRTTAEGLRRVRRPDAGHLPAGERHPRRRGDRPVPEPPRSRFRAASTAGRRALNRLLAARIPETVEQAIAAAERSAAGHLDAVGDAVPALDPTLTGAVASTRGRIERELGNLRGKVVAAAKRRDSTLRRQFERARAQSFPGGAPQERSVAGVYFLNRYGFALVDRLLADLPLDPGHHWLLTV